MKNVRWACENDGDGDPSKHQAYEGSTRQKGKGRTEKAWGGREGNGRETSVRDANPEACRGEEKVKIAGRNEKEGGGTKKSWRKIIDIDFEG